MSRLVLSRHELPPLPATPARDLPLWHPTERCFYVLSLDTRSICRVSPDGEARPLAHGLELPGKLDPVYLHGALFYFDRRRQAPALALVGYDEIAVGLLQKNRFTTLRTRNGVPAAGSDSLAYDEDSQRLVHLAGVHDIGVARAEERAAQGGLALRYLDDLIWQEITTKLPRAGTSKTYAGWDARRRLVLLDEGTGSCFSFDGKGWKAHGRFPSFIWGPCALFADHTGRLWYLQRQRAHGVDQCHLWRFDDRGWKQADARGIEVFGGAAVDPERGETMLFGPWWGPGTAQRVWGRLDLERETFVEHGPLSLPVDRGSTSGPPLFFGAHDPDLLNHSTSGDNPRAARFVCALRGGGLVPLPPSPPVAAVVAGKAGRFAVGFDGEIFGGDDGAWKSVARKPRGFALRTHTSAGIRDDGAILVVGGRDGTTGKEAADCWLFEAGKWRSFRPKGRLPGVVAAMACFDPARGRWIVGGGTAKYRASEKIFEIDEGRCDTFDLKPARSITLLAFDRVSQKVIAVARDVYQLGPATLCTWEKGLSALAPLDIDGPASFAYDDERRVIVAAGNGQIIEFDIAQALPAAAPAPPASARASAAKASPAPRAPGPPKAATKATKVARAPARKASKVPASKAARTTQTPARKA